MSQIYCKNVSLRFTEHPLLDDVTLRVEPKDRIAIVGRNGAGKSTLMKMIEGEVMPDTGSIERNVGRITRMAQAVPRNGEGTVGQYVAKALSDELGTQWADQYVVDKVLSQLQLQSDWLLSSCSGGQLRRCLLAAALVVEPDILLLDEPTNHLDLESIAWLESFLAKTNITFIVISHDRSFLQAICNQIIELDRGKLIQFKGSYEGFIRHREQQLAAQEKFNAEFDKRLAQEEVWIRQGIKARRTRNEGRVRALQKMRAQYAARRKQQGTVVLQQQAVEKSGKQVFLVEGMTYRFEDRVIVNQFSCLIQRGDKVGIIGPNGCGKSTLIRCLLQELTLNEGSVTHGTQLKVAYFDQHREQLDPDAMVMDVVSDGRTAIDVQGKSKHIMSYLQDFLFTPQQARSKVRSLSGGECNRLLLAKLFSQPANVLILDEPTNDLDIESLELLEDYLLQYSGTVLLISHDRSLLNNVVTSTLVFEEQGHIQEYVGGYDDYLRQRSSDKQTEKQETKKQPSTDAAAGLSYEERRELKKIPLKIERLESKIEALHQLMSEPGYYEKDPAYISEQQSLLDEHENQLQTHYGRWEWLLDRET